MYPGYPRSKRDPVTGGTRVTAKTAQITREILTPGRPNVGKTANPWKRVPDTPGYHGHVGHDGNVVHYMKTHVSGLPQVKT
jgi:hypothetical protein